MQRSPTLKSTRKVRHQRRTKVSPYLLDEVAFTRADIERARTEHDGAAAA